MRIPPLGLRGAASSTRASRYGFGYQHYLETANDTLVTMAQIETTTVLATNRGFAKVSPAASFEFDLPKRNLAITEQH